MENEIKNESESKNQPENYGVVLYLLYDNGCRSVKDFNEKLSKHYHKEINLTAEEISHVLKIKSSEHAGSFNEEEITE